MSANPTVLEHFGRRLLELMQHEGYKTEREFAVSLGIHPNTWTQYKKGKGAPDLQLITNLCDKYNLSIGWFLSPDAYWTIEEDRIRRGFNARGDVALIKSAAPPYSIPHDQEEGLVEATASMLKDNVIMLPRFDVAASAGIGRIAVNDLPTGEVAFGRSLLRRLGGNPDFCYVLEASGDSMWPTIGDGSLLIADSSQQTVDDGRIYHFNVGNRVLVKRARWQMDGSLQLVSDNAAAGYPPEVFGPKNADEVRAGGRIIFVGGQPLPAGAI